MDVYPLERKGKSVKEYSVFLRKQHDELLTLLEDPCPAVRVIAIKVRIDERKVINDGRNL